MTVRARRAAAAAAAVLLVLAVALVTLVPLRRAPAPSVFTTPGAGTRATVPHAVPRTIRVMPLGDSITYGIGSTSHGGYRTALENRLTRAGMRVDFVGSQHAGPAGADDDNEGHPGWTIARIHRHVDGWLRTYRPDVVLLHAGTNDLWRADRAPGAAGRLSALIDRIRTDRPRAQIFVAQLIGSSDPATQARIDRYNAAVATVAARKGSLVHLVDQRGVTAADLTDLLHPRDTGYVKMAAAWFRAIRAARRTLPH